MSKQQKIKLTKKQIDLLFVFIIEAFENYAPGDCITCENYEHKAEELSLICKACETADASDQFGNWWLEQGLLEEFTREMKQILNL